MEDLDRKCSACNGTGRAKTGHADVDALEHDMAQLRWKIADLTEDYGLDLRHRREIPGEADARQQVGALQVELAEKLRQLAAARRASGSQDRACPQCHGKGLVLTEAGERVFNFIYRWIHPTS